MTAVYEAVGLAATEAWLRRWRVMLGIIVTVTIIGAVISLVVGIAVSDSSRRDQVKDLPSGVQVYNVAGDGAPEFAKIDGELVPVSVPAQQAWWIPFVPFLASVMSALIAAAALILTNRGKGDFEKRIEVLEKSQRSKTSSEG